MNNPVQLFDALGLGFFAVFGAHKALAYGHNIEVAIILGVISAVGGGVMRDILLNRTPLILRKEIYASAALVAAAIQVVGEHLDWSLQWVPWVGIVVCFRSEEHTSELQSLMRNSYAVFCLNKP